MNRGSSLTAFGLLLVTSIVGAEEAGAPRGLEAVPDVPPPPERVHNGQTLEPEEPEVTIIQRGDATVEEYRVNGNLYMVKVTPIVGPAYYLLDQDGDGNMETNMSEIYSNFVVPQWVLFRW